jgi:hypothetical protein
VKKHSTEAAPAWAELDDEALLGRRICDLKLRIAGSPVEPFIQQLYDELDAAGIRFKPRCYLATEWLCPDLEPLIGIPFCLAHPRLRALEKTMMLEVEGGSPRECMQLLRHETGHALNYAYKLYRRSRWRELFGPMSTPYNPHSYQQAPYSRRYVVHLKDNYAQAHPDEDFAETVATWLTPGLDWRRKYAGWGAITKLEYVDHLMEDIAERQPLVTDASPLWPANRARSTLKTYYKRKRREFAEAYPGYYDDMLKRIFTTERGAATAYKTLRGHRAMLRNTIARWGSVPKYAADQLIRRLAKRCKELDLHLRSDEATALVEIGILLTAVVLEADQGTKAEEGEES